MAEGFTLIGANETTHAVTNGPQTLGLSITPAIGEIVFCGIGASVGTGAALTGCGMTWDLIDTEADAVAGMAALTFRASAGTPEAGDLSLAATDNFRRTCVEVVRPVDLTYVGMAGGTNSGGASEATRDLTLTNAGAVGGYLCYGFTTTASLTWTPDAQFTELDDGAVAGGHSQQVQYVLSDEAACTFDPSSDAPMCLVGIEFASAGASASALPLVGRRAGLAGRPGMLAGGSFRQSVRGLFEPAREIIRPRLIVPVGITFAGAR